MVLLSPPAMARRPRWRICSFVFVYVSGVVPTRAASSSSMWLSRSRPHAGRRSIVKEYDLNLESSRFWEAKYHAIW